MSQYLHLKNKAFSEVGAAITIDLDSIASNWKKISSIIGGKITAATVKSNAYGLGIDKVATKLYNTGCKNFFVANAHEALSFNIPNFNGQIYVLGGPVNSSVADKLAQKNCISVINHKNDLNIWSSAAKRINKNLPTAIHIDTGMNRLGFNLEEILEVANLGYFSNLNVKLIMSHLSCADEKQSENNLVQSKRFENICDALSKIGINAKRSLANSAGIFLGKEYHYDMVRPGASLFGINASKEKKNPMAAAVSLESRILQIRNVAKHSAVGYGATYKINKKGKIATIAVGYADGLPRNLSSNVSIGGIMAPIIGRISMDLTTIDISHIKDKEVTSTVEVFGKNISVDYLASKGGTIPYNIFTSMGNRIPKFYINI